MGQEIKGKENGPYLIVGTAVFIDADGNEQTTQGSTIALCRCGQSGNKPFCDGTPESRFSSAGGIIEIEE